MSRTLGSYDQNFQWQPGWGGWNKEIKNLLKQNEHLTIMYNRRFKPHFKLTEKTYKRSSKRQTALRLAQINGDLFVKIRNKGGESK